MGLEFTRGNSARCPPFLVGGLMIMCLFLLCSWWSLSSENFELLRQNDNLAAQLRINGEELKDCQNHMTQLEVQVNTIKETNQELQLQCQKNKDVCETEMESLKKEGEAKEKSLETLKENKNSLENSLKAAEKKVLELQKEVEAKSERVSVIEKDLNEKTEKIKDLENKLASFQKSDIHIDLKEPIAKSLERKLRKNEDAGVVGKAEQNEAPVVLKPEVAEPAAHDDNGGETKADDAAAEDGDPREREMLENGNNVENS